MKNKDIQKNEFKTKASVHVIISKLHKFEAVTICTSIYSEDWQRQDAQKTALVGKKQFLKMHQY